MAATNTNAAFLSIDAIDISALWIELKLNPKRGTTSATAGSNVEWESVLPTLKKVTGDLTIRFDSGAVVPPVIQNMLDNDTIDLIYGPEGNTSGDPKHEQTFTVTGIDWAQMSDKSKMLQYKISLESTGTPTSDMFSGDSFA